MRTLGHLLNRYRYEDLAAIDPAQFFASIPNPTAANLTLDGKDNMVSDYRSFAGTIHRTYLQRVAEFLALYESNLRSKLFRELCPLQSGFDRRDMDGLSYGLNGEIEVGLDWAGLTVSQAEACWERYDPRALDKAHEFAHQVFLAARSTQVDIYRGNRGPSVSRNLGAVSVQFPLIPSGDVGLAIYAKARDRLRIEVRYRKNLPDKIRGTLPIRPQLTDWFDAIREDATKRISGHQFLDLCPSTQDADEEVLADLLDAVADVTKKAPRSRRLMFLELLRHGSITGTGKQGAAPTGLLEKLAERGILQHVRLIRKDSQKGRRYRLTPKYAGLCSRSKL